MSENPRLSFDDARRIYQLLDDCRRCSDDCQIWLRRLVDGLKPMFEADFGNAGQFSTPAEAIERTVTAPPGQILSQHTLDFACDFFLTPHERHFLVDLGRELSLKLGEQAGTTLSVEGRLNGSPRAQLITFSRLHGNRGDLLVLLLSRDGGPFSPYDRQRLSFIAETVGRAIGATLCGFRERRPSELPRRAQDVLSGILNGEGDKQIAQRLKISPHTVNQYLKQIYTHFAVGSRAELMSLWINRGFGRWR
jgi:DNA-binding CsgD family transcriptional regulator